MLVLALSKREQKRFTQEIRFKGDRDYVDATGGTRKDRPASGKGETNNENFRPARTDSQTLGQKFELDSTAQGIGGRGSIDNNGPVPPEAGTFIPMRTPAATDEGTESVPKETEGIVGTDEKGGEGKGEPPPPPSSSVEEKSKSSADEEAAAAQTPQTSQTGVTTEVEVAPSGEATAGGSPEDIPLPTAASTPPDGSSSDGSGGTNSGGANSGGSSAGSGGDTVSGTTKLSSAEAHQVRLKAKAQEREEKERVKRQKKQDLGEKARARKAKNFGGLTKKDTEKEEGKDKGKEGKDTGAGASSTTAGGGGGQTEAPGVRHEGPGGGQEGGFTRATCPPCLGPPLPAHMQVSRWCILIDVLCCILKYYAVS